MANDGFNGTTLTFGAAVSKLRSLTFANDGQPIDTSSMDNTDHNQYITGFPDPEISVEVVGISSIDIGDTGTMQIAWFDGSTEGSTNTNDTYICTNRESSGDINGELSTSLTLKPADL
jgi:hypothetical protein